VDGGAFAVPFFHPMNSLPTESGSRPPSTQGADDDAFSLDSLKRLTDPPRKPETDPNLVDLGVLTAADGPGAILSTPKVVAPPSLAQIAAPASRIALMGMADPSAQAQNSLALTKLWPVLAVVGAMVAILASIQVFRTARSTPAALAPTTTPEPQAAAPAPADLGNGAPEPNAEEPHVPVITPGQRVAREDPTADPSASASASQDPAPVARAPRFAPKAGAPRAAPQPSAPKPPVNACGLQCQMQRAVARRH
jgi:hypothetical protein